MAETKTISERLAPIPFAADGNAAEGGVVRGVVICGLSSANGRDYPRAVLEKAAEKYDGAPVFIDHAAGRDGRSVREWFGEIRNPRPRADGRLEGDLHYETANDFAAEFESRSKKFVRSLGMSHVVEAKTSRRNGREIVESIERVISVDLVASPATATSLFESRESAVEKIPFRQLLESLIPKLPAERQRPVRKWLVLSEDDADMGAMLDAPVDAPAEDAGGEDAMDDAFKQLMHTSLDKLLDESHTLAEFLKNVRAIYKTRAQVTGNGKGGESEGGGEEEETPKESKRPALKDVVAECKAAKLDAPPIELVERLTTIADADTRKFVIEQAVRASKVNEAEPPRSAARGAAKTEAAPKKPARILLD